MTLDNPSATHIFLVDDHPVVLEGVKSSLKSHSWINIVGTAGSGGELLEKLATLDKVDVVLLDMGLGDGLGSDYVLKIKEIKNDIQVIIYSMYDNLDYLKKALQAGADGYLLKDASQEELLTAIKEVRSGVRYFSNKARSRWIEGLAEVAASPTAEMPQRVNGQDQKIDLTPREKEILILVAQGLTSKMIGEQLKLNPRTIETHRRNLMLKLGIHSSAGLTRYALAHGYTK